jgi:hypothetical protein
MRYVDAPLLAGLPGADPAPANPVLAEIARSTRLNAEPGLISPSN